MQLQGAENDFIINSTGEGFDLWLLSKIIEPNDQVTSLTTRRKETREELKKVEKIQVVLTVRAEKIDLEQEETNERLRIIGTIEHSEEFHGHHSLIFERDEEFNLTLHKAHNSPRIAYYLELARDRFQTQRWKVLSLSRDMAVFAEVNEHQIKVQEQIHRVEHGKSGWTTSKDEFEQTILDVLKRSEEKLSVICGVGFFKEQFARKHALTEVKVIDTMSEGIAAIHELLEVPRYREAISELHIAKEHQLLQRVIMILGSTRTKEGAEYGLTAVQKHLDITESVILTDALAKEDLVQPVLLEIQKRDIPYHLLDEESSAGQQLTGLGGIASILFYRPVDTQSR